MTLQLRKPITAIIACGMLAAIPIALHAQEQASGRPVLIKTNLLYDATTTLNLGVEFGLGRKTTLDIPISYNPWTFSNGKKWKHVLVQPEIRLWNKEKFSGGFWGLHAHYAFYNVGGLNNPPFSAFMNSHRFEGWLAGAGVSYGYKWNFSRSWGVEATVGVGYAYLNYDKYPCQNCGTKIAAETKHYFGPTKAGITLTYSIGNRKSAKSKPSPVYVPMTVIQHDTVIVEAPIPYQPLFAVSYITPEVEAVKVRADAGSAYLDFGAGGAVIRPEYKNNAVELLKIKEMITTIQNDQNATITGITIDGFSSPEGTYNSNINLSKKRAIALKEHIKRESCLPESLFIVNGKGEDWAMLDTLVSESNMASKSEVLSIIRTTGVFDGREQKLMALSSGNPYRQMLTELFPQLRRTEYQLHYTVSPFTVEECKEVFKTRPSTLSLNEMFLMAQTYQKGSSEFNDVFETAARIFPSSDTANLNAAASALSRKDAQLATHYLSKVRLRTSAYFNNMGILYFLQGDIANSKKYFSEAAPAAEAAANANQVDKHLKSKE